MSSFLRFFGQFSSKTMVNYFLIFLGFLNSYLNISKIQFIGIFGFTFFIFFILNWCFPLILYLLLFLATLVPVLISVAFYTLAERKIMAILQRRMGPNVVGFWGLLQAIADGLKLVLKEIIIPTSSNNFLFVLAPIISMVLAFTAWVVIPFNFSSSIADLNLGVLFLFMLSGLNIYSLLLAGWASNSSFAFLACLRSIAQMISYEISIGLCLLPVLMLTGSSNLTKIVLGQVSGFNLFPLFPWAFIFFISILVETNRAPFDLPEAEAELVAGYNVEYSSATFALFFLAEYSNMLVGSAFWIIMFWGGWLPLFSFFYFIPSGFWFAFKIAILSFIFILIRAMLPRYRYDQLMDLGWKIFLPVCCLGPFWVIIWTLLDVSFFFSFYFLFMIGIALFIYIYFRNWCY